MIRPFFIAKRCLAQDFKSLAQDHILLVTYLLLTCYLPRKFYVISSCPIENRDIRKTPETRCFRGMPFLCNIGLNYRLLNCGARRAAFRPYFFLSFIRGSLVRKPSFFRTGLYSASTWSSALAIPCLMAPACPV